MRRERQNKRSIVDVGCNQAGRQAHERGIACGLKACVIFALMEVVLRAEAGGVGDRDRAKREHRGCEQQTDRGAWYAGLELPTSQAEVAFHKWVQLVEINRSEDTVVYDDYLADFSARLHDLRPATPAARRGRRRAGSARGFGACLDPDSYVASQALAERLLASGSLGVIYPSVRRQGGTCIACFRPALVTNVRRANSYRFTWKGKAAPVITVDEAKEVE